MTTTPAIRTRTRPVAADGDLVRPMGSRVAQMAMRGAPEPEAVRVLREYTERKALLDPFQATYAATVGDGLRVVEPQYSFYALMRMPNESDMLRQCIDAMVTNCDGFGHRLEYTGPEGGETSAAAMAEKVTLDNLLDYPNEEYGLQELRDRLRRDRETLGVAFMEVGRDTKGRVVMLNHLPGHTMRLTTKDGNPVVVEVALPRDGKATRTKVKRTFRRFIQSVGTRKVWFKEFGDPRPIDPTTGYVNAKLAVGDTATEVIMLADYEPSSPYSLPRWFSQLPAIMGNRQAALTNLDFFKENAIPAMVLMVAGGMVTQVSLDAMEQQFTAARGRQSMNRLLVIEATGDANNAAENGSVAPPKLELKAMQGDRQQDGLFQSYSKDNRDMVRSSFRLPPLFVGLSEDHTFATAKVAYEVAEQQVFGPERGKTDDMFNLKILASYQPKFWKFRSNAPRLSNGDAIIDAMDKFEKLGALTPNIAISLVNEFFDMHITPVTEPWGDLPFTLVSEAVNRGHLSPKVLGEALRDQLEVLAASEPPPPVLDANGMIVAPGVAPTTKPNTQPNAGEVVATDADTVPAAPKPTKGGKGKEVPATKGVDEAVAVQARRALLDMRTLLLGG